MRHPDTIIVGGGPAGSAAAITLARAGAPVTLLERSATPQDALCGGFMSWTTLAQLARLGVDPATLGGIPMRRVALFAGTRQSGAALPHPGMALSRRRLDTVLRDAATAAGATVEMGAHVTAITDTGVHIGTQVRGADAVILATGKHELRGHRRAAPAADPAMGLRWRLPAGDRLAALVGDAVELHLFSGGYAGLALQEDGTANLCMAVRRSLLTDAGGDPERLLEALADTNPALAARLDAATAAPTAAQAVANVPYGWIAAPAPGQPYRVGDQSAVIPSLAGEGMAIALASGVAAARAILGGIPAEEAQRRFAATARRPVRLAATLWHVAEHRVGGTAIVRAVAAAPPLARAAARLTRITPPGG